MNMNVKKIIGFALVAGLIAGCSSPSGSDENVNQNTLPSVSSTTPANLSDGVELDGNISARFNKVLDSSTITAETFYVSDGSTRIDGVVTYLDESATFDPTDNLTGNRTYTATIAAGVKDVAGNEIGSDLSWSFTTALGPVRVNLGTAENFVVLSKSGIDTIPTSVITGDIGVSPAAAVYITQFSLVLDAEGTFSKADQVSGKVYASDYADTTPDMLGVAIVDMAAAGDDAAQRPMADFTNLGSGNLSSLTMAPGLYRWTTGITVLSDVTLQGGPNDVWIFQIDGVLSMGSGVKVILKDGARAKNIFWKVNSASLNTGAHLEGIVLANTAISLATGSSVNGRLFSKTAVTMDSSTVTEPAR